MKREVDRIVEIAMGIALSQMRQQDSNSGIWFYKNCEGSLIKSTINEILLTFSL